MEKSRPWLSMPLVLSLIFFLPKQTPWMFSVPVHNFTTVSDGIFISACVTDDKSFLSSSYSALTVKKLWQHASRWLWKRQKKIKKTAPTVDHLRQSSKFHFDICGYCTCCPKCCFFKWLIKLINSTHQSKVDLILRAWLLLTSEFQGDHLGKFV